MQTAGRTSFVKTFVKMIFHKSIICQQKNLKNELRAMEKNWLELIFFVEDKYLLVTNSFRVIYIYY